MTPDDLAHRLGSLLLGYAGIVERESEVTAREDVALEIVRLELWYRLRDYDRWYEVAHRLIFEVLPILSGHQDWIDSRQVLASDLRPHPAVAVNSRLSTSSLV